MIAEAKSTGVYVVDPRGQSLFAGDYSSIEGTSSATGLDLLGQVVPQSSAFEGVAIEPGDAGVGLVVIDEASRSNSKSLSLLSGATFAISADPTGGLVVAAWYSTSSGSGQLLSFDSLGALRWMYGIPEVFEAAVVGVDELGNTLLLLAGANPDASLDTAQWFDPTGQPQQAFSVPTGGTALFPTIGGGLFEQSQAYDYNLNADKFSWTGFFPAAATTIEPAPPWLAARSGTNLIILGDGRGYAVLPSPGGGASCSEWIEILTLSGDSCGKVQFPSGGDQCNIGVGIDGTVIELMPPQTNCDSQGRCACSWEIWPALLP